VNNLNGLVDNSGIRLYYTSVLRIHNAGILQLGDFLALQTVPIPEGTGTYEIMYDCPSNCLSNFTQPLNAISSMLHMHERGSSMWSDLWRNGQLIQQINRVDFYSFNLQQTTPINITIMPGDRISTHCIYDTNPDSTTIFGLASYQEMCIDFLLYWPKIPIEACGYSLFGETYCGIQLPTLNPTIQDPTEPHTIFGSANSQYVKNLCSTLITNNTTVIPTESASIGSSASTSSNDISNTIVPISQGSAPFIYIYSVIILIAGLL